MQRRGRTSTRIERQRVEKVEKNLKFRRPDSMALFLRIFLPPVRFQAGNGAAVCRACLPCTGSHRAKNPGSTDIKL
jgi:hypothetical protein